MTRIGIVAVSRPALGGTFQYTLSMIDALRQIPDNEYTIYTSTDNDSYDGLGIPIVRIAPALKALLAVVWTSLMPGRRGVSFSEVDVVIAPIYTTRLLACRRPFAFTIHDLQERYYPDNFTMAQRCWRSFANHALANRAQAILCESNHVKSDIGKFLKVDESKIIVIAAPPMSAFTAGHLDPELLERRANEMNLPGEFIFYPAQFFPHKNHMRLIDAFAGVARKFPQCHLLLTGQARYEYAKVMAHLTDLSLESRVMHLGYVDTDSLAAAYSRATFVVIPTLFESISIPIYEAFRLGVPVCASNVVALPEQVGDAGVLFDPLSIEDMTNKMCGLLADDELRRSLVIKGREKVNALTTEWYATQLARVLNAIAFRSPVAV
jgi:glycosyltransferase involved in cell wall biosynthesis